jgi:hypothetical protein
MVMVYPLPQKEAVEEEGDRRDVPIYTIDVCASTATYTLDVNQCVSVHWHTEVEAAIRTVVVDELLLLEDFEVLLEVTGTVLNVLPFEQVERQEEQLEALYSTPAVVNRNRNATAGPQKVEGLIVNGRILLGWEGRTNSCGEKQDK